MKLKFLALCLVIALMVTMLSSCEILKFTNHMLNIFGPDDKNEVNLNLDIVIPGNNSGNGNGNTEHVHNWITIPGKPSTCTVSGYSEKIVCDTCGEVRVESTKLVLAPHTYDDSWDRICNVCAYTRNCTHSQITVIPGYPATETENGLTDGRRCNFCNETLVYQMTLYATGTAGLTYEVSEDKTGYIVTGITSSDCSSIYIPKRHDGRPVVGIGNYAFDDCQFITSIVISDGVTSIGFRAFQSCTNLENIVIPESVTYIDEGAFVDCDKLASISLPSGITTITNAMFSSCNSLTDIVIPDGVTSIDAYAFNWCTELKNIVIPNGVTSIGDYAFQYCEKLENITIGNKVTSIGAYAFRNCTRLKNITFEGTTAQWKAISNGGFLSYNIGDYTVYCTDGTIAKDGTVTYN